MSLTKEITYLKGVGSTRAEAIRNELHVHTCGQMLHHFPFRYIDKARITLIAEIAGESVAVQLSGEIIAFREAGEGNKKRLTATFKDQSGEIELVWFKGLKWIKENILKGQQYLVYGKPSIFKSKYTITHPEMEVFEQPKPGIGSGLKPVYSTTEKLVAKGLNSNGIWKLQKTILEEMAHSIEENLSESLLHQFKLMPRQMAFQQIHMPESTLMLEAARRRLKFEELFFLQLQLGKQKLSNTKQERGAIFRQVGELFNTFYHQHLPFELTGAQKRVIKEIRADVARGSHMNRLIQGDVGSGKTIVALLAALIAMDNGFQACLMAPTEILAQQHFQSISEALTKLKVKSALLTGSTSRKDRTIILDGIKIGSIKLLVGTHALIEPVVAFKQLGLVIIDEQHRFGVAQRAKLWQKAELPPHVLVMTATPIPRTLAMTLYGDLDISVIDELPPGRKPIVTQLKSDASRLAVFQFMEDEIKKGRQIYVVYPLIEESEALDYKHLHDGVEAISRRFPLPDYRISVVHGQMKTEARDYEMQLFVSGQTQIMVATTVIEVGVNVPNASVMIIESAERFGLSQLHQLRGRVGRGAEQSYCILMTGYKLSKEARLRLQTMVDTNDGFKIAEVDLQLRGPGDLSGTQQSGMINLKLADLARDQQMLSYARESALEILDADPFLQLPENRMMAKELELQRQQKSDWSRIS